MRKSEIVFQLTKMKGTFKVLMFKHGVVRVRRFIHTAVELISPTVFFLILFAFKNHINQPISHHVMKTFNIYITDPTPLESVPHQYQITTIQLFYTPENNITTQLMEQVGDKLGIKRLNYFPKGSSDFGYYPVGDVAELSQCATEMSERQALIVFENVSDSWPVRLEYTIRMKNDFMVDMYKSLDDDMGPHMGFGLIYETFMRIQWAVHTSYLLLGKHVDIKQTVSLQEFPYVMPRNVNSSVVMLCTAMPALCCFSLLLPFVFLTTRLMEERTSGIEEVVRMAGAGRASAWAAQAANASGAGLAYAGAGAALLGAAALLPVPPALLFAALALHYAAVIATAFACAQLLNNAQYAVSASVFAYAALWVPAQALGRGPAARVLVLLLPHAPLHHLFDEMAALAKFGEALTWANAWSAHTPRTCAPVLCLLAFALQACLFLAVAWYLALVSPGPYGQPLPWNFPFKREYWSEHKVAPHVEVEETSEDSPALIAEAPPPLLPVGIRLTNVSKVYAQNVALSNVSLDIFKGEITVLLGHNGAGKTTLMNIITGMTSATAGQVCVEGMDGATQRREVRRLLGLCPQHNASFPELTVSEHVVFFAMLKGASWSEARAESRRLLTRLGLSGQQSCKPRELSGGMRRRLQLALALVGGAALLLLDEPTAGLDLQTRRGLWDLLLSLRGERTVVLSTHLMEEADALGDRVAALHRGRLRAHATPMHLKRALGSGYRLSLTTVGIPREQAITAAVRAKVADASLKEASLNTISYNLPSKSSPKFPELFSALESGRSELAIDSIGVGVTTLEEVFLKLCSDVDTRFDEDSADGLQEELMYKKVTGPRLYWRQFVVLFKRQGSYLMSKKYSVLILQVILPILTLSALTWITLDEKHEAPRNHAAVMDFNLYSDMPERRVLYNADEDVDTMQRLLGYENVRFEKTNDVVATLIEKGSDMVEYNKYLIGLEVNDTDAKVLYSTAVRHAAPVALDALAKYAAARGGAGVRAVSVRNEPLGATLRRDHHVEPKSTVNCLLWATGAVFVVLATAINLVSLPCKERERGTRLLHALAGCPAAVPWVATVAAHAALAALTLVTPALVAPALLDSDRTLSQPDFLGAIFVVLFVGSLAFLAFMYLVSFYLAERAATSVLVACVVIFGLFTTSLKTATEYFKSDGPRNFTDYVLSACSYAAPPHALTLAAAKAVNVARLNAMCLLNKPKCPSLHVQEDGFDARACCELNSNPRCYFCIDDFAPGEFMLILFFQFVVYMSLVILTQDGVFNRLAERLVNARYRPRTAPPTPPSELARAESTYVSKAITLPADQIQEAMLVDDVHKNYIRLFGKSCNAVKGVSFSVRKGECFGLLGVNGAGKSSTFRSLTAEEVPTRGRLFAGGHRLEQARAQYMRSLSYCPQFSGLDGFLSGYDNLALLLTLRGLSAEDVDTAAKSWIEIVELARHGARAVARYSGGMARRMGAAAALACTARVALLDEPSAGVDVAARRRLWAALRRALRSGGAVVVTSHSMEEMEALCERIAIVSAGRVRALGSAAALRARHAAGHALRLKLGPTHADVTDGGRSDVGKLKGELHQRFHCQLKDEHKTMLHYHIQETMRYSDLFTELESLKDSNPIIEDYSVSETTLEEVFLSFAKEAEENAEIPITPV